MIKISAAVLDAAAMDLAIAAHKAKDANGLNIIWPGTPFDNKERWRALVIAALVADLPYPDAVVPSDVEHL